jgi:hypothetical protein
MPYRGAPADMIPVATKFYYEAHVFTAERIADHVR